MCGSIQCNSKMITSKSFKFGKFAYTLVKNTDILRFTQH